MADATVHAAAVLVGARAVLIRGPSGSGKSRLALALIEAAPSAAIPFARLVADDRVMLRPCHGRLLASAPVALAALLEVRGIGVQPVPHEPEAVVGWVVDLAAADAQRMPEEPARSIRIDGILLPRLAVLPGIEPWPLVRAFLKTTSRPLEVGEK